MGIDPRKDLIVNELEEIDAEWVLDRLEYKDYRKDSNRLRGLGLKISKGKITNWKDVKNKTYTRANMVRAWNGWFRWVWWWYFSPMMAISTHRLQTDSWKTVTVKNYKGFYCLTGYE